MSALILAVFFYSGITKIREKNPFQSLIPQEEIYNIEGYISSNPVKTAFYGSSYKAVFTAEKVWGKSSFSSARGEALLYFSAELVESYYPGKLYSSLSASHGKGLLIENGAKLFLSVRPAKKMGENAFIVSEAKALGWQGKTFGKKIFRFRALCRLQFKRLMYAWGKAGGLLLALLTGSREYTEKSLSDAFRDSGLSHILALSGMHLGLFGSIAHFFGKKARGRNFGDGLELGAVCFFVWFAGISPSLFRAFLTALILYLNSLFRMNRPDSLSLLSLCFIIHSLIFPGHIHEAAFALSYSSLAGIILFSKLFRKIYPAFLPYRIRLSVSDSTAAQLATAGVSVRIFGKIMPQGIIASLFLSPLVVFFLYFGLFAVIICLLLPFLSGPISAIMNGLYLLISRLVLFFSFK